MNERVLGRTNCSLILQPHLSHRDDGSLAYATRDSESYLSEVKDLAQNDKLNDTLFISAVVVLSAAGVGFNSLD